MAEARAVVDVRNGSGDRGVLWLAPTGGAGFCMFVETGTNGRLGRSAGGSCGVASGSSVLDPLVSIPGPVSRAGTFLRSTIFAAGAIFDRAATSVDIRFGGGAVAHPQLVVVSGLPFRAAFFVHAVPRSHLRKAQRPTELIVRDGHGRVLAKLSGIFTLPTQASGA
jgi:hypothetical protein